MFVHFIVQMLTTVLNQLDQNLSFFVLCLVSREEMELVFLLGACGKYKGTELCLIS